MSRPRSTSDHRDSELVIPAQAGIPSVPEASRVHWIAACAAMTAHARNEGTAIPVKYRECAPSGHLSPWLLVCVVLSLCWASTASAVVRAWIAPDRVSMGQTVTLNLQTDQDLGQAPDLSALASSFDVLGQSSNSQVTLGGSGAVRNTTFVFELAPKQPGVVSIAPIQVGTERTDALTVTVLPAQVGSASNGDPIYLESHFETTTPYVQQPLRYTVKLFFAVPLINGGVEAPAPENAALQALGEERQYQQEVAGRTYNVYERAYLLLPERSGTLTVPAPVFRGRARSNNVDPFFDRGQTISAAGQAQTLQVRPQPANAPTPWLPARSVRFTRAEVPQQGKVGEPLTLELTLQVDGVGTSQLPELKLPDIPGAQVFPEAPQQQDQLAQGIVQAQVKRRFAIVPNVAGALVIPELKVSYFNTSTDQLDAAVLPQLDLDIAPGAITAAPAAVAPALAVAAQPVDGASGPTGPLPSVWPWQVAVAVLALAWLVTLTWCWRLASQRRAPAVVTAAVPEQPAQLRLRDALQAGNLQQVSLALAQLSAAFTPEQQALADQLQQALWSGAGSQAAAGPLLASLRQAFRGPIADASKRPQAANDAVLPELYPRRG